MHIKVKKGEYSPYKVKKGEYSPYKVKDIKEVLVVKQVSRSKLRPAKNYFNRK